MSCQQPVTSRAWQCVLANGANDTRRAKHSRFVFCSDRHEALHSELQFNVPTQQVYSLYICMHKSIKLTTIDDKNKVNTQYSDFLGWFKFTAGWLKMFFEKVQGGGEKNCLSKLLT